MPEQRVFAMLRSVGTVAGGCRSIQFQFFKLKMALSRRENPTLTRLEFRRGISHQ